jgi:hypothetical protein
MRMKGGDACARLDSLRQVFITFEPNSYPNFGRNRRSFGSGVGNRPKYPKNATFAANRHALTECDLRRHAKREFDLCTFGERCIGEEEDSPGAQILRETDAFDAILLTERSCEKVGKSLSDTAFNSNWRSGHQVTAFAESPNKPKAVTLTHIGPEEKLQVSKEPPGEPLADDA